MQKTVQISSSPESETDWFPSSTASYPPKRYHPMATGRSHYSIPLGKKLGQWLGLRPSQGGPVPPGPEMSRENTRCRDISPNHLEIDWFPKWSKNISIANKSRTWKISIKNISFTVVSNNLVKKLLKQHIPNFLVILPPNDVAINARPHPTWLHRWAEHQFFNFSFQAVHLCLIAMSKHASSEDGRIPCSNGLFLDFHVGFWESTCFSQTNIKWLKHEVLHVWLPCFMWKSSFCMRANKSQPHLHLDNGLQSSLWHVRWRPWKTTTASVAQVSPFKWHAKSYPTKPKG